MGLTHVTVSLTNLRADGDPFEDVFLVNTGAIDCLAPAKALFAAGIPVEGIETYELANGEVVAYPYGFARVSFMRARTVTQVIFGPENCVPFLGIAALENTGLCVDPATRSLVRIGAKPLK